MDAPPSTRSVDVMILKGTEIPFDESLDSLGQDGFPLQSLNSRCQASKLIKQLFVGCSPLVSTCYLDELLYCFPDRSLKARAEVVHEGRLAGHQAFILSRLVNLNDHNNELALAFHSSTGTLSGTVSVQTYLMQIFV